MKTIRKFLFGLSLLGFPAFGFAQGTVVYTSNPVIQHGMKNQGAYSAGTTYTLNDVVTYSGSSYLSLVSNNTGHTPSSSPTQWQVVGQALTAGTDYATPSSVTSAVSTEATLARNAGNLNTGTIPTGRMPTYVSSVNGKSGAATLGTFDVGATVGPIANTSLYYTGPIGSGSSIDTIQGYVTYWVNSPGTNFQVVFGNSGGTNEAACGPKMTIRAAVEYPVDSTPTPIYFDGARDVVLDACGMLISDPIGIDTTTTSQILQIRYKATRAAAETAAFLGNWSFGGVSGNNTVLAPYTTTKAAARWDGIEELKTRTVADGVATASSTTFTSATAAFVPQDAGQSISVTGAGAAGAVLNTTIASYTNATTVVLAAAAGTTVSNASTTITPTDKTTSGTIYNNGGFVSYAPHVLLGKPYGVVKTAGCVGHSIEQGTGGKASLGSWCVQALNQAGVTAGMATSVHASDIGVNNESQPSELVSSILVNHKFRFSLLGRDKYVLGMFQTNDIFTSLLPAATLESNFIKLVQQQRARGSSPFYGTVVPQTTSTDGWLTVANQTVKSGEAQRVLYNAWLRDGAPMTCSTQTAAATGASSSTAARAAFYSTTGTLVSPASGPCSHPAGGVFELADVVESAHDSGIWKQDSGVRTITGCSITTGTSSVTCPASSFTSADVNRLIAIPGAGAAGATFTSFITAQTGTTATLFSNAGTTVSGASMIVDGDVNTSVTGGRCTGDGVHPSARCHREMGISAGTVVATWTW